jgi:NNP family nitrate/nitrite transporter-like MFS transporter
LADPHYVQTSSSEKLPSGVLAINTSAFALCFAAWVMFGPSSKAIAKELHLTAAQATLLKSFPVLLGSTMRIPVGILTDKLGARRIFASLMAVGAATIWSLTLAASWLHLIVGAFLLGMVGTTFAVGVQAVSSWTPGGKQGIALGIFGAGNAGTALTTLGMPLLLAALGWREAFRIYAGVMALAAAGYYLAMRDAPRRGPARRVSALLAPLARVQTWRFGLYYMATFGTFVGLTLVITDLYTDAYHLTLKQAGLMATSFTLFASLARIPGGKLADRYGARPVLRAALIALIAALVPVAGGLSVALTGILIFVAGLGMGVGMAASMRYVPEYFPQSVGAVGGIVGALGGLGGFFLPLAGNAVRTSTGSIYLQVVPLVGLVVIALFVQTVAILVRPRTVAPAMGESLGSLAAVQDAAVSPTPAEAPVSRLEAE